MGLGFEGAEGGFFLGQFLFYRKSFGVVFHLGLSYFGSFFLILNDSLLKLGLTFPVGTDDL